MNIPENLYHGTVHSAVQLMIEEKMIVPKAIVYVTKKITANDRLWYTKKTRFFEDSCLLVKSKLAEACCDLFVLR